MSNEIKPGDLVMVVKPAPCCGSTSAVGWIGRASAPPSYAVRAQCGTCGKINWDVSKFLDVENGAYHIETLKKIDPPALVDEAETTRELEAV